MKSLNLLSAVLFATSLSQAQTAASPPVASQPAAAPTSGASAPTNPATTTTASALDLKALCQTHQSTITQRTQFNFEPNYFAKLYATKNYSTVIYNGKTFAVNLDTGHLTNVEGTYDPVPTPDEVFLVTIEADSGSSDQGPLYFQSSDVLGHSTPAEGFTRWQAANYVMSYAYQSLGLITGASTGPYTYRFLVDDDAGSVYFRDDYFTKGANSSLGSRDIHSSAWVAVCSNIQGVRKLPMISKDGHKVAFYNTQLRATQIYDVNDKGICTNGQSLPFITGKADFSFDNTRVAFHMGRMTEPTKWFETADPARRLDVFVWNFKTKTLTRLTDVEQGNAYFPSFRKNGNVGFLMQTVSGSSRKYSYVIADPSKGISLDQFPDLADKCNCRLDGFSELAAIGVLKDLVCKSIGSANSLEAESALPLTLNHEQCTQLMNNYWSKDKTQVIQQLEKFTGTTQARKDLVASRLKTVTTEELVHACPNTAASNVVEKPVVSTDTLATTTDPVQRLEISCSKCHTGDAPKAGIKFDLQSPMSNTLQTRQKMAAQISAGSMPPGGLNDSDRKMLEKYLLNQ